MPMERIKERLSDVAHNWTYIAIAMLFLFTVQPGPTVSQALTPSPVEVAKTERQLKREILDKFSNETYKHSEMLAAEDLRDLLWAVGFEGIALKTAWAVARVESNGRPLALITNAEITYYMTKGGTNWSSWPNSIGKARNLIHEFPKS